MQPVLKDDLDTLVLPYQKKFDQVIRYFEGTSSRVPVGAADMYFLFGPLRGGYVHISHLNIGGDSFGLFTAYEEVTDKLLKEIRAYLGAAEFSRPKICRMFGDKLKGSIGKKDDE